MITGAHAILYSTDAEADRAFFRDVLELPFADAGHGWLIFALPPAELAVHPAESSGAQELYLTCDDVAGVRRADDGLGRRVHRAGRRAVGFDHPGDPARWREPRRLRAHPPVADARSDRLTA